MKRHWIGWIKFGIIFLLLICAAQFSTQALVIYEKTTLYTQLKLLCIFLSGILLSAGKRRSAIHPSVFVTLGIMALILVNMFLFVIPGISNLLELFFSINGFFIGFALLLGLLIGWLIRVKSK